MASFEQQKNISRRTILQGMGAAVAGIPMGAGARRAYAVENAGTASDVRAVRMAQVYKGAPPDLCVCDQTLRALPSGDWIVVFMTGGVFTPETAAFMQGSTRPLLFKPVLLGDVLRELAKVPKVS